MVNTSTRRLALFPALLLAAFLACPDASRAWAAEPTLDQMLGQMLLIGFRGLAVDDQSPVVRDIEQLNLGGVILFDRDVLLHSDRRNVADPVQVSRLTAQLQRHASTPLFIAVDQEGGKVARLSPRTGFPATPSAQSLGGLPAEAVQKEAALLARALAGHGFNLDFAPVVDVAVNPDNPVIARLGRAFSSDPGQVARLAGAFVDGMRSQGVLSCLKHFPGHGSSREDSHLGLTDISDTWTDAELLPYQELVSQCRADMIMPGHLFNANLDPRHPASLSRDVITGLLRERLGFQGVVVSDDLQMGAVVQHYSLEETVLLAVNAGADILLFGNNLIYDPDIAPHVVRILRQAVEDGRISQDRIRQSYDRILTLKQRLP